jgi:NTE family protein
MTAAPSNVDLVFEGGGVKGIGLVGAISVLEERGFVPKSLAGASAGAIVATLLAAGYSAKELYDVIINLDFRRFEDRGFEDRIPVAGPPLSILKDQGIFEGKAFLAWIGELLEAKGVHTFADLVDPETADDPRYRYRVRIIASDLTSRALLALPQDAVKLGLVPDAMPVAEAVRMSMSIPFFFEPVRVRNPQTGRDHLIADGGVLSNFPVWLFDSDDEPEWPTFGLLLVEPDPMTPLGERLPPPEPRRFGVGGAVDYAKSLIHTMLEAHDRLYVEKAQYARTIPIKTLGVGTTEFDLPRERAEALYQSGRKAAEEFLEHWDFDAYIAEFRRGKQHSRRSEIAAELELAASRT